MAETCLSIRCFPDGAVVFIETNGDLHAVSPLGAEILKIMDGGPTTIQQMLEMLGGSADSDTEMSMLESLLQQLTAVGLIKRSEN